MNSKALRFHEGFLCGLASFMKNSAEVSAFLASLRLFYFASEWEMNQSPYLCRTLRRMWQNPSVFLIRPSIFAKIADSTHSCTANPEWEPIDFPIVPPSSFPLPDLKIQSRLQVMYSHTFAAPWTLSSFLFAPGIHNALLNLPLFFAHALPAVYLIGCCRSKVYTRTVWTFRPQSSPCCLFNHEESRSSEPFDKAKSLGANYGVTVAVPISNTPVCLAFLG